MYKPVQIPSTSKWKIVMVIDGEEMELPTSRIYDSQASAKWGIRTMMNTKPFRKEVIK